MSALRTNCESIISRWTGCALVIGAMFLATGARAQLPSLESMQLADRNSDYFNTAAAAAAATEQVIALMSNDFVYGGEARVITNLAAYQATRPFGASIWSNYAFTAPPGNSNGNWVGRISGPAFVTNAGLLPGLGTFESIYRVATIAQPLADTNSAPVAIWQDIGLESVPAFDFAIFYDGPLEFSDSAPFTVTGLVHGNSDIDVGTISLSFLTLNSFVTASGIITNPARAGFQQSSWTGPISYNGSPAPGWDIHQPVIPLPLGPSNAPQAAMREIINPPPPGEDATSLVSQQRFYNKAYLLITVTNPIAGTGSNNLTAANYSVWISVKNTMFDPGPVNIYLGTNINSGAGVNWTSTGISNWLSTNIVFFDLRENRTNHVTQIDVGKLGQWIGSDTFGRPTNSWLLSKWPTAYSFNGIVYVQDRRTTNSIYMNCVRLVNGQAITNGLYQAGLTLATQNPLYVAGLYNCPGSTNLGSTNTMGFVRPCAFICDALTVLSPNWMSVGYDSPTYSGPGSSYTLRPAVADTINAAIIAGNVPSTDPTAVGFSGGVMNLPRLLENWTSNTLTVNTSLICVYTSAQATRQFQMPGNYYTAPTRQFSFDPNFLSPTGLPAGTPQLSFIQRLRRTNPSPSSNPAN